MKPDGTPEGVRRTIDNTLNQLNGRKKLDIFEYARRDQNIEFKVTLDTEQKEYIDTGKVGGIALSECRAETIHEAVKHIKVAAVEVELSLYVSIAHTSKTEFQARPRCINTDNETL
jgi:pyridoxine 4-dehydrogenase